MQTCADSRRPAVASAAGFTLVELLLAVALTAVVAGLAYAGLANGISASTALATEVQQLTELQRALAVIEDDLWQVRLRPVNHGAGYREPAFVTAPEAEVLLAFTRAGALQLPDQVRSPLTRIRYVLRDNALWRQHWPAADRSDALQPPLETLLLEQVRGVTLELLAPPVSVFGNDAPSLQAAGGNWQRSWNSNDAATALASPLPLAVRLTLMTDNFDEVQRVIELP